MSEQYTQDKAASDLVRVGSFLVFHESGYIMGGQNAEQAFNAFCRLMRIDNVEQFRAVLRGEK